MHPLYNTAYYNLANVLHERGQWEEAVAGYRRAVKVTPGGELPNALVNMGMILKQQGREAEARQHMLSAVALQPSYWTYCDAGWGCGGQPPHRK